MKFNYSRETWKDFFRIYFGIGAFLFGLAAGFQGIAEAIGAQIHLDYSIKSIITLIFMLLYIFLLYKTSKSLFEKRGYEWMGAIFALFFIGCIINAILTGGKYLPFVGWLLG